MDTLPASPFRAPFTFRNSDAAILRFPFPLREDRYVHTMNLEPHRPNAVSPVYDAVFDIDEHYEAECAERAAILARDPLRCQVLPHMDAAEWDTVELLMQSLAADYPADFALARDGAAWHWTNRRLGLDQRFTFGDRATLAHPFDYIVRQVQGDFTLQGQRDGTLWLDGGCLTTAGNWSLDYTLGMNFAEWHSPVPGSQAASVFGRALAYLLALRVGAPVRRLNWSITVNPHLDTGSEVSPDWAPDRDGLLAAEVGHRVCLRVELQTLHRLARSNAILFGIRCFLIRLEELARVPDWARRLHRVVRDLDPQLTEYKGMSRTGPMIAAWLAPFDDGAPVPQGAAPGLTLAELRAR